jgi:ornithine racemase
MARIEIDIRKIQSNIRFLCGFLEHYHIQWTLVLKAMAGYDPILREIITLPEVRERVHSIAGSHIDSLKIIKTINPLIRTMYIKPPSLDEAPQVVQFADISLNTSFRTLAALQREAQKQKKTHKVIIMIEMGELREGILRDNVMNFYEKLFKLANIEVIGLGTNLGCMYGIEPTYDKLIQLSLYEQLIEARFNHKLELVSGGSSITLPLIKKGKMPLGINHFRIGEAALLGTSPLDGKRFLNLDRGSFVFYSSIVELYRKENTPDGVIGEGNIGHTASSKFLRGFSYKAIMDFGMLDTPQEHLIPVDPDVHFVGNSSDMTVYDIGANKKGYRVGDNIAFSLDYLGVANLMGSRFVEKRIVSTAPSSQL